MVTDFWHKSAKTGIPHLHSVHRRSTTDGRITTMMSALTPPMTSLCLTKILTLAQHPLSSACALAPAGYGLGFATHYIFTFIHQKAGSNNRKRQAHEKIKHKNTGTWCKEYTKCYKLARYFYYYLQRNVPASWLALRMTFGLFLPNIPSSCVTARCLNNQHNVFFVAEKACRNLAVLISNCISSLLMKII